jgi:hypothetical protein
LKFKEKDMDVITLTALLSPCLSFLMKLGEKRLRVLLVRLARIAGIQPRKFGTSYTRR